MNGQQEREALPPLPESYEAWEFGPRAKVFDAKQMHAYARAALAAKAVPAGWKLVLVEPTPEMIKAGRMATDDRLYPQDFVNGPRMQMRDRWDAMLAATPPAPAPEAKPAQAQQAGEFVPLSEMFSCPACEQPVGGWLVKQWSSMPVPPLHPPEDARRLTDVEIFQLRVPRDSSDPLTKKFMLAYARAVERACAEAWGVKLAGIGASSEGDKQ